MIVTEERKTYYKTLIRRILVRDGDASGTEIQEVLKTQKVPIELGYDYVLSLVKEIDIERAKKANKLLLKDVLIKFMERIKETDKYLWQILSDEEATNVDKTRATAELRKNWESMMNVMFDAGIFDRKIGDVKFDMNQVFDAVHQLEEAEKNKKK
jgi:hypothetical protein